MEKGKPRKKKFSSQNDGSAEGANASPYGVANMAVFAARTTSSSLSTILGSAGDGVEKFVNDTTKENMETNRSGERFSCQFCAKTFPRKVGLRKHKLKKHPGQQAAGDEACEFCPRLFKKSHMFQHMIAKHPLQVASQPDTEEKVTVEKSNLPTINLPTINLPTINLPTINLPTSTTQFTEIKARCQFCPKAFAGQEFLEKHIAAKHPEMVAVEKELVTEFQCDQCQKYLGSKSALKNHMPLHLEEKPFKCEHCGKEFSQSGNLRIHVKRYHTNQEHEGIDI